MLRRLHLEEAAVDDLIGGGAGELGLWVEDQAVREDGVREGAHRAVRERAGLEADALDQEKPGPWRRPQGPGL